MNYNREYTAKKFLTYNFVMLFAFTSLFVCLLGLIISCFHLREIKEIYVSKIKENIELQKNEFLNEIALRDDQAIWAHIEILQKELQVDSITLNLEKTKIFVGEKYEYGRFQEVFDKINGASVTYVSISNDFATVHAIFEISYFRSFEQWILVPFFKASAVVFLISLILFGIIFVILYLKVNRMLIKPLVGVTRCLSGEVDVAPSSLNSLFEIKSLISASKKFQDMERMSLISELASQVSHDIRSPLMALNMVMSSLEDLPEEKRLLIRTATQRINDIANQLLNKGKDQIAKNISKETKPDRIMLISVLDIIVSEKCIQFQSKKNLLFEKELNAGYGLFSNIDKLDFGRAISNIINNSVESCSSCIKINISRHCHSAVISFEDNGRGIEAATLSRLGERGFSSGKDNLQNEGFGLGIHQVKSFVEKFGGTLSVQSMLGNGTSVILSLPLVEPPTWFVKEIIVKEDLSVVSVDDNESVIDVWRTRFSPANISSAERTNFFGFSNIKKFADWKKMKVFKDSLFLVDYEFDGENANGIDLIENLGIRDNSILVTSRQDDQYVLDRAEKIGLKVLPKSFASYIPIYTA